MKLRNKILMTLLVVVLLFGVSSCGTKKGVVSFNNYEAIVLVNNENGENASTFNDVINLLGTPTDLTNYDTETGDGYLVWDDDEGYVEVTFVDEEATNKTQTGLYQSIYTTPIGEKGNWWDWVITQLGLFTFHASNLFGILGNTYYYWIGLLIMTLVIRTLGWPIYAKTNDMSLKMQLAQPELNRIQEKYRNKQDQASQQRMQMETMELYKKYKINVFGCLMPLLQMPIFIAMYQVVQRFPLTDITLFGGDGFVINDSFMSFLWMGSEGLGNTEWLLNLPLAILVSGLMFLSQWLTQHRTKTKQRPNQYAGAKAQQSQNTMKYMMYFMVLMMGFISLRSAGIAFYWVIGTSYQLLQSYISYRNMEKRQDKLRKQF
ncbi:YidC/Oxa1 family membrane protein insertase [Candidatus Izemoplasma sp. B36]|uniref:YidC/Oxa1 family membrane protein insertase n=1 Tax=Candidatus Izemoplasma sp. B36 TaxID=3242468 RepID=UPI003558F781